MVRKKRYRDKESGMNFIFNHLNWNRSERNLQDFKRFKLRRLIEKTMGKELSLLNIKWFEIRFTFSNICLLWFKTLISRFTPLIHPKKWRVQQKSDQRKSDIIMSFDEIDQRLERIQVSG